MKLRERYRKKKTSRLFWRATFLCVLFIGIALGVWSFFRISYFRITHIVVAGKVSEKEVKAVIDPFLKTYSSLNLPHNNYFLLDKNEITKLLAEAHLGVANIHFQFPNTISVSFPDQNPKYIYCNEDQNCFYISENGVAFRQSPRFSESPLPEIRFASSSLPDEKTRARPIGEHLISTGSAQFLEIFVRELSYINASVAVISFERYHAIIALHEGWYVITDTRLDPETIARNMKLLLDQKIRENRANLEYIDLRFPKKAFYQLR